MIKESQFTAFEQAISYTFSNKKLMVLAFTHSSYANEDRKGHSENNERLEFLGDAVLDLVISKYIYEAFPDMPEGELTKLRAGVVCEATIAEKARDLQLGSFLLLGRGEESTGGRKRDSILADAFEAVIGAIYLDGGMEQVERYTLKIMVPEIEEMKKKFRTIDCKTRLQEVMQQKSKSPITYEIIREEGPDHDKVFVAEVSHENRSLGQGMGKSKKEAEQNAAQAALQIWETQHGKETN